jgi:hypothetical protein
MKKNVKEQPPRKPLQFNQTDSSGSADSPCSVLDSSIPDLPESPHDAYRRKPKEHYAALRSTLLRLGELAGQKTSA